jgi:hypothetical protein
LFICAVKCNSTPVKSRLKTFQRDSAADAQKKTENLKARGVKKSRSVEFMGNRPQIDAKLRESDADPAGSFAAFAACKNFSWARAKSILLCRSLSPSLPRPQCG